MRKTAIKLPSSEANSRKMKLNFIFCSVERNNILYKIFNNP